MPELRFPARGTQAKTFRSVPALEVADVLLGVEFEADALDEVFKKQLPAQHNLDAVEPAEASRWIAERSNPIELASFLDDWAFIRRNIGPPQPSGLLSSLFERVMGRPNSGDPQASVGRLIQIARAVDPDPWRDALRSRVFSRPDDEAIAEFRRLADNVEVLDAQLSDELRVVVDGSVEQVYGQVASGTYFDVLGLRPVVLIRLSFPRHVLPERSLGV